jgi:hypothetical protein
MQTSFGRSGTLSARRRIAGKALRSEPPLAIEARGEPARAVRRESSGRAPGFFQEVVRLPHQIEDFARLVGRLACGELAQPRVEIA